MSDETKRWEEVASQLLSLYDSSQNDDSSATSRTVMNAFRDAFAQFSAEVREQLKMQIIYEAACCSGPHPINGNPGIVGNWLDALKSPSHLLPKK